MTQEDVKDYVLLDEHNCYLYKTQVKSDGSYYFIRNKSSRKMIVVYPVNGVYTQLSVYLTCIRLDIPLPDYAKSIEPLGQIIRNQIKNDN